jgi:hypothetical protein
MKIAFAFLLLFSAACAAHDAHDAQTPASPPPVDIRGTVTKISGNVVLVEEQPGTEGGSAKAAVRVTETSVIEHATGRKLQLSELAVNQRVSVWYAGPVMESYPVRADAARILVER